MIAARQQIVVEHFCQRVNDLLRDGQIEAGVILDHVPPLDAAASEDERALLDTLRETYRQAVRPTDFVTRHVAWADEIFEQCYELLRLTFQPAELSPREGYVRHLTARAGMPTARENVPYVMMGRFWRVAGPQRYDAAGRLAHFGFDPLMVTEQVASVISGNLMPLVPPAVPGASIGAIGHLATREHLRRRGGHGGTLVAQFERAMEALAAARGETLSLLVLEAEPDAMAFWARQGYRWPVGSRYAQPPLDWDPDTGERRYDEVPELLMVKNPHDPGATTVDAQLLRHAVRTLYENWCLARPRTFAPHAAARAEQYVEGVYAAFEASLPAGAASVPLGEPPASIPTLRPAS